MRRNLTKFSLSFNKASRDRHVSIKLRTPAACVAGGYSTKELPRQLINLSILSLYMAAPVYVSEVC
jgi:hypothetical protein